MTLNYANLFDRLVTPPCRPAGIPTSAQVANSRGGDLVKQNHYAVGRWSLEQEAEKLACQDKQHPPGSGPATVPG